MAEDNLLKTLFSQFPTASIITDVNGKLIQCSTLARQMFVDLDPHREDKNILDLIGDQINWTELISNRTGETMVCHIKRGNSIIRASIEELKEHNDQTPYFLIHFNHTQDIQGSGMFDRNSKELVLLIEPDGMISDASNSSYNIVGYEAEELIGRTLQEFAPQSEQSKIKYQISGQLNFGPHSVTTPFQFQKKDKDWIWLECEFQRITDSNGKPLNLVASVTDISKRVEAENQKEEFKQRFAEVFQSIHEGIVYQDAQGLITNANKAAEEILGLSLDQMQGRDSMHPKWRSIHEDGSDFPGETHPAMQALNSGKIVRDVTMGVYHPEKRSYVWIKTNSYPLFNNDRVEPVGVFTTFFNITAEYKQKKELERSESLFRTLFDNSFQFIGVTDTDGRMIKANKTGLAFLGMTNDDIVEAYLWNTPEGVITEKTKIMIQEAIKKASKGQLVRFDFELLGSTNKKITLDFSLRPVFNDEGEVILLIPEGRDITSKKEMSRSLSQYSTLMASIIESMPTALFYTDTKGTILRLNSAAQFMFGYSEKQLIGQSIKMLLEELLLSTKIMQLPPTSKADFQTRAVTKDGNTFPIRLVISRVLDNDDSELGSLFLMEDITEHIEAERLKSEFTSRLAASVEERTHELSEAKQELEKALETEKELNALKTHFVLSASHQFRTPLTIIQSNAEILEQLAMMVEGAPQETFKTYSDRIAEQVKRTTSLMDDILLLGKISAGVVNPDIEETDLIQSIEEFIEQYRPNSDWDRLSIQTSGTPRPVKIDKKLFLEALSNLISNAVKYSEKEIELLISYIDKHVSIDVVDHGIGISKADMKNLFQPFFRSSQVMEQSGTGLGLSIAKEYIEIQGGAITCSSKLGKGTTFSMLFPA